MRSSSLPVGVLALSCLVLGSGPAARPAVAQAPATELKKLHVLLALDTLDPELKPTLDIDEARLKAFLIKSMPEGRYALTVMRGKDLTEKAVLDYYRKLKPSKDEGLVFFYGGHGAVDRDKGHYFDLTGRRRLLRSDLREAMQAKNAGLVVILSDCCSTPKRLRERKTNARPVLQPPEEIRATVRDLFFQARGTVDVTAATDNASWSDTEHGGIFTRALVEMLSKPVADLDVDRDGKLSWNEVFPQLRERTLQTFTGWRRELIGRGERIEARTQKPAAFFLGEQTIFAVVGIENATSQKLTYHFRWTDLQETPVPITLAPGEKKVHFMAVGHSNGALPRCEAQFPGIERLQPLKVREWKGATEPTYRDGVKYRLKPKD